MEARDFSRVRLHSTDWDSLLELDEDLDDYVDFATIYWPSEKGLYNFKIVVNYLGGPTQTEYASYRFANLSGPWLKTKTESSKKVKLHWEYLSKAEGYRVYRATTADGTYKLVKTITNKKTTTYIDKTPSANKQYYYVVCGYATVDGTKTDGADSAKTVGVAGVVKTKLTSIKSYSGKVVLKWEKSANANGYVIYRATSKNGKYSKIKTITKRSTTSYSDKTVKSGSKYYYKIKSYVTIGKKKYYSSYSNIKSVTATSLSEAYLDAKAAYKALKKAVYYPDTLVVKGIYSAKDSSYKVILFDYTAENSYGEKIRSTFVYYPHNGYWEHADSINDYSKRTKLSTNKVI